MTPTARHSDTATWCAGLRCQNTPDAGTGSSSMDEGLRGHCSATDAPDVVAESRSPVRPGNEHLLHDRPGARTGWAPRGWVTPLFQGPQAPRLGHSRTWYALGRMVVFVGWRRAMPEGKGCPKTAVDCECR
jgi:hypothetical protein